MPLANYNEIDIHRILQEESPPPVFPPFSDRETWEYVRSMMTDDQYNAYIAAAEKDAAAKIPELPLTLWMEFMRTGERDGYQEPGLPPPRNARQSDDCRVS